VISAFAAVLAVGIAAAADPEKGKEIYGRCLACHALEYDRVGPRHCGLFGRRAGSVPGFAYSEAMKRSKIVWNEKTTSWAVIGRPSDQVRSSRITTLS